MVIIRNYRRPALIASVFGTMGLAVVTAAGPALAANTVDVTGVGPANIGVNYACDAGSGVTSIQAMAGDPNAEAASASGKQPDVTCDGAQHSTVIVLTGAPLAVGQQVQIRVALTDSTDTVVTGQAKVFTLG
ncbi:hypothetical protein BJY24_001001 [Nocardia transvalensis]|uniref:Uncharacterized protein n=1 Tax=Nocardia transvalensis TaxID=37333 RepID=A0A7W9PAI0_9NOCA|nr:hypothetical protein [Nocardia transvalensis]MBB5912134.1 hypothetical protein [Nocardia transvalensis]